MKENENNLKNKGSLYPDSNKTKGFLYPNSNKNKASQPDYTGRCLVEIDGVTVEKKLAAWENVDTTGQKYFAIMLSNPLSQDNKNLPNNTGNSGNNVQRTPVSSPISDDLEDLDAILRIADDDNPFNS